MNMSSHEMAQRYEAGATIEQIALDSGRAPTTVRRWLARESVVMRKAYAPRTPESNVAHRRPRSKVPEPTARIVRPGVARGYR